MRYVFVVGLFTMLLLGTGCTKPKTGDIEGAVTFQDKPLKMARLHILAADGSKHVVPLENGKYTAKNIPVGPVKFGVYVETVVYLPNGLNPPKSTKLFDQSNIPIVESSGLPEQYEKPETSGLTGQIHEGKNTINLQIK